MSSTVGVIELGLQSHKAIMNFRIQAPERLCYCAVIQCKRVNLLITRALIKCPQTNE